LLILEKILNQKVNVVAFNCLEEVLRIRRVAVPDLDDTHNNNNGSTHADLPRMPGVRLGDANGVAITTLVRHGLFRRTAPSAWQADRGVSAVRCRCAPTPDRWSGTRPRSIPSVALATPEIAGEMRIWNGSLGSWVRCRADCERRDVLGL